MVAGHRAGGVGGSSGMDRLTDVPGFRRVWHRRKSSARVPTAVFSVVDPRSMMHALPSVDGVLNRSHMHGVLHGSMSPQPAVEGEFSELHIHEPANTYR